MQISGERAVPVASARAMRQVSTGDVQGTARGVEWLQWSEQGEGWQDMRTER